MIRVKIVGRLPLLDTFWNLQYVHVTSNGKLVTHSFLPLALMFLSKTYLNLHAVLFLQEFKLLALIFSCSYFKETLLSALAQYVYHRFTKHCQNDFDF